MIRPHGGNEVINRRLGRPACNNSCSSPLDFQCRRQVQFAKVRRKFAQDEFARGQKPAVQKNRAQQRFKRIGQDGWSGPPARILLARLKIKYPQPQRATVRGERRAFTSLARDLVSRPSSASGNFS